MYLFSILRMDCTQESRAECMTNIRDVAMPIGNHPRPIASCLVCRLGNDSAGVRAIHKLACLPRRILRIVHTYVVADRSKPPRRRRPLVALDIDQFALEGRGQAANWDQAQHKLLRQKSSIDGGL